MKTKLIALSLVVSLAMLTGCASGPTYTEYASSIPAVSQDSGRIYVYRVAKMGAAVQPKVKLNEEAVGKAVPMGFFYVDRPAGNYIISASTEAERSLSLNIEAGEEKYVRLEMKMGFMAGHVKPVLVDSAVGKKEITKTKYIGEM